MIVHVMRRARDADVGRVVVATDSAEIADEVFANGGCAVMTNRDHPSGSDRIFEALGKVDPEAQAAIVVNVQGDFPMLDPSDIHAALEPLSDPAVHIATIVTKITGPAEFIDPNVVKAVCSPVTRRHFRALNFTRTPAATEERSLYHHIGLYAYRRSALERFVALPPSPREQSEKLEQLRALEDGMRIDATLVDTTLFGVDTPEHLEKARALLARRG
jgi:3-deoxy-manno-octulosonate cytidylyltransferase (CMP-KDO synthetase)